MPARNGGYRAALTRLTRLAEREPDATEWIRELVLANMPGIIDVAIDVSLETKGPLPEVLTEVLADTASSEATASVARRVPLLSETLRDAALHATRSLLADPGWPQDLEGPRRERARQALTAALARRLVFASRFADARSIAQEVVVVTEPLTTEDPLARSVLVDAHDVLSDVYSHEGESRRAVEEARRAFDLRRQVDDPFRPAAAGAVRLGAALAQADLLAEAAEILIEAVSMLREEVATSSDPLRTIADHAASSPSVPGLIVVRAAVTPTGFEKLVVGEGLGPAFAAWDLLRALRILASVVESWVGPAVPTRALEELDAGRRLLRKFGGGPDAELWVLEATTRALTRAAVGEESVPFRESLADEIDRVAVELDELGDVPGAIRARMLQIGWLRATGRPATELASALDRYGHLLAAAERHDEAVSAAREAFKLALEGGDSAVATFSAHNLSRRLAGSGQHDEAFEMSTRAVSMAADLFLEDDGVAIMMIGSLVSLVTRGVDCAREITLTRPVRAALTKLVDIVALDSGMDVPRILYVLGALVDSAERRRDHSSALALYGDLVRLGERRPDSRIAQVARGEMASALSWSAIQRGDTELARQLCDDVASALASAPGEEDLLVAQGKCVWNLIHRYLLADEETSAADLAAQRKDVLLSPAYLAARQRDLGHDPAEFEAAIEDLAALASRPAP